MGIISGGDMKRFLKIFLIIFFLLSLTYAKEYVIRDANLTYNILPTGEIEVKNQLTYDFSGSFSRAWMTIPKGGYSIREISVGEIIDGVYVGYTYHRETSQRIPQTFDVVEDNNQYKITWFYRANNTNKTFVIKYKLVKALKVYNDVAEFYWKVWGGDWDVGLPALWVEVNLPSSIKSTEDILYWLHPEIDGKIGIRKDYKGIVAFAGNIPPHQWVEIRLVFPKSYLSNLDPSKVELIPKDGRVLILDEEQKWQKEELAREERVNLFLKVLSILVGLLLFLGIFLPLRIYFKYGREPKVEYDRNYEQEPPADIPPAWVEALVNQSSSLSANSIVASTLELARRGYIKIQEEEKKGLLGIKHKEYKIIILDKELEKDLSKELKLLLEELKSFGEEFYISDLKKKDLSEFKEEFDSIVKNYVLKEKKWINEEGKYKLYGVIALWIVVGILWFMVFSFSSFLKNELSFFMVLFWFILFINIVISAIFIHPVQRYSPEGKLLALRWKAFKRYLKDFSLLSERPPSSLVLWEKYLVYATVLGVAKEVLKAMQMLNVPVDQITWYVPATISSMNIAESIQSFSSSLESFSNAFTSSVASSTSSGSSSGGGGGAD